MLAISESHFSFHCCQVLHAHRSSPAQSPYSDLRAPRGLPRPRPAAGMRSGVPTWFRWVATVGRQQPLVEVDR